jgi:hypothetical protein
MVHGVELVPGPILTAEADDSRSRAVLVGVPIAGNHACQPVDITH